MSKTNRERAKKLFYDYVETTETFTEIVTIALDKAERRGARKVCRCCKPQPAPKFDAEKVHKIALGLFNLASKAYSNNMSKGYIYWESYKLLHIELLAALGLEGNDE